MTTISVKARFNDDTRRFQIKQTDLWEALKQRLITTFNVADIRVKYTDEEYDEISLDSQAELLTAIEFAQNSGSILKLRIEDLSTTRNTEVTSNASSFEDFGANNRLRNKKIWKNEKKLKKERKRYYAALAEDVGESRKETALKSHTPLVSAGSASSDGREEAPTWFISSMEKFSKETVQKILDHLEGAVIASLPAVTANNCGSGQAHDPHEQYLHCDIECDGCGNTIIGVRYKCGNCADYDLCEQCEPLGIHDEDHVFIKLRRPTYVGCDTPLLCRLLYSRPTSLHITENDGVNVEKVDVQQSSVEADLSPKLSSCELDSIVAAEEAESSISSLKGHRRYLDAKFVSDINLPDNSFVFLGVPFAKSWLVKNAGSKQWRDVKLVHKEGHMPTTHQVVLPDLQPGEETQVTVNYSPIGAEVPENKLITSSWRFVYKDNTVFGDELWLSVFGLNNNNSGDGTYSEPYDIVESPTVSLISITTAEASVDDDTLNARGCHIMECKDDVASSIASDDSFVVVIPDCFDPGVPLLNPHSPVEVVAPPPNTSGQQQPAPLPTQQHLDIQEPSVNLITFEESAAPPTQFNQEPHPQDIKNATPATLVKQTSKDLPKRPPPLSPMQMIASPRAHILKKSPWQVAAGLVDTTMHQVDKCFGQPSGLYADRSSAPQKVEPVAQKNTEKHMKDIAEDFDTEDDDEFKDCNFDLLESVDPKPKPSRNVQFETNPTVIPSSNMNMSAYHYHPHIDKLPAYTTTPGPADHSRDVLRLVSTGATQYQPPPPWTPRQPETPMQQLMNLGFGNRQLNTTLLHKHDNSIQAVVNELLDAQC